MWAVHLDHLMYRISFQCQKVICTVTNILWYYLSWMIAQYSSAVVCDHTFIYSGFVCLLALRYRLQSKIYRGLSRSYRYSKGATVRSLREGKVSRGILFSTQRPKFRYCIRWVHYPQVTYYFDILWGRQIDRCYFAKLSLARFTLSSAHSKTSVFRRVNANSIERDILSFPQLLSYHCQVCGNFRVIFHAMEKALFDRVC